MPYGEGPNTVANGLCLRSDLHTLFDRRYLTVTPDYRILVSRRIRDEFRNGREYYASHGCKLKVLPDDSSDMPGKDFLDTHNQRFVA